MTVESVKEHLSAFGRADDVRELEVSSATVALAAEALGIEPALIAKTVSLYGAEPGTAILVVAAGDARIDNAAFKARFGMKARMLGADDVLPLTGHPIGGVCPFANPATATVYLDESLRRFEVVHPAAGSANSSIGLTLADLETISGAVGWVDVCGRWRDEAAGA